MNNILYAELRIANKERINTRNVYNIIGLLGDLGGLLQAFTLLGSLIIGPIAAHLFWLKAIQKLILIKTKDKDIIAEKNPNKKLSIRENKFEQQREENLKNLSKDELKKVKHNHLIKFTFFQLAQIFFM